ncbi:MAG: hypothetical protein JJU31_07865 [Wenzhouxiangella sp.]|nr:hypothetical protein [Wenzhouxiangella sp.]MCH8478413.1 hypothetical protein [Wenzhouxiangella sp.]
MNNNSNITHDIANELHVIKGMTDSALALLGDYSPAELPELNALKMRLSKILSATDRLEALLDTMRESNSPWGNEEK